MDGVLDIYDLCVVIIHLIAWTSEKALHRLGDGKRAWPKNGSQGTSALGHVMSRGSSGPQYLTRRLGQCLRVRP